MPQDDAIGVELRLRWAFYVGDNMLPAKGVRRFLLSSHKSNSHEHGKGTAQPGGLIHESLGQRRAKRKIGYIENRNTPCRPLISTKIAAHIVQKTERGPQTS
jgi:hypothetical protein